MEKKEYLNEETYQRSKKKISTIALIVLIAGIFLGGSLITIGIIKSSNVESTISDTRSTDEIQSEIDSIDEELITLKAQKNQEFQTNGFSEEYYRLDNEISKRENRKSKLETEIWKNESGYNSTSNKIEKSKSLPFIIFGVFIIFTSLSIAGFIYFIAKRREITAFSMQQIMPIAQEGMEKMAPTVGKVAGNVAKEMTPVVKDIAKEIAPVYGEMAKEVAKGIKEGLKEDKK